MFFYYFFFFLYLNYIKFRLYRNTVRYKCTHLSAEFYDFLRRNISVPFFSFVINKQQRSTVRIELSIFNSILKNGVKKKKVN